MLPVIGITMGDPAGIGAEIIVRALTHREVYRHCIPVVLGSRAPLEDALAFTSGSLQLRQITHPTEAEGTPGQVDWIEAAELPAGTWHYGEASAVCGDAAFSYIRQGIQLAMDHALHAVVTGPICKESLHMGGHRYAGHTEIFAQLTSCDSYAMMLTSKTLRVIHVTTHVSMREACDRITKERVFQVIGLARQAVELMGIPEPRIAVAGFNAHCSENGLFGSEEAQAIQPAIVQAQEKGWNVTGPIAPDTVFVKAQAGQYDIVVAMYHDQGHIPVKLSGFRLDPVTNQFTSMSGVNITVGLPIIRTSVDHGTAFDRAGKGVANEESMLDALDCAAAMARVKLAR